MNKLLVLKGGNSSEREISLKTGGAVEEALETIGIPYASLDVKHLEEVVSIPFSNYSGVFLALHGGFGEDGTIQGILEGLGLPFNGARARSSAVCMSKFLTKLIAKNHSISVPDYIFIGANSQVADYNNLAQRFGPRFIVKPDNEGCSVGVSLVSNNIEYNRAIEVASSFNGGILCEEFIQGEEITVGFLNGNILPPLSIKFTQDFFSFDAKFHSKNTTRFDVAVISSKIKDAIVNHMRCLSETLGIYDYFRADFIISSQNIYLLEVNTLPGLNGHSVFPKACKISGIDYTSMVKKIISSWPSLVDKKGF